jgi:hypothetical protein
MTRIEVNAMAVRGAGLPIEQHGALAVRVAIFVGLVLCISCSPRKNGGPGRGDGDASALASMARGAMSTNGADSRSSASSSPRTPPSLPAPAIASANVGALSTGFLGADGGAHACRIVRGPVELPMRGAVSLAARGNIVDAVLDDDGRAHVVAFPAGPIPPSTSSPVAREPATEEVRRALAVPCASTADWDFCPDRSGAVHRIGSTGAERVVASSRSGTRIAAGLLADSHNAFAYLASRQTSEGWVSEAWVAVDDDVPVRLSEDGSGATSVAFAMAGSSLIALTVDARTALTAMHARQVSYDRTLHLGEDAVVFVGGPGDRRTAAILARLPGGPLLGLLPISKDVGDFGLALVKLDDPPRVDEPVAWVTYPNGLDPAPIAAATSHAATWIARIRPQNSAPGSQRELEIGELVDATSLSPRVVVQTTGSPSDVAIAVDAAGALWVAWLDAAGSWLERLACR